MHNAYCIGNSPVMKRAFISLFGIQQLLLMDVFQFSVGPLDGGPLRCRQQSARVAFEEPSANAVIRTFPKT